MFNSKSKVVSRKTMLKKISKFMTSNFFTIEEFNQLTYRESKKVVKYLAKIQKVKLSRNDINEIINFLRNTDKPKLSSGVFKLFANIKKHFVTVIENVNEVILFIEQSVANFYLKFLQVFRC